MDLEVKWCIIMLERKDEFSAWHQVNRLKNNFFDREEAHNYKHALNQEKSSQNIDYRVCKVIPQKKQRIRMQ